jgi:hypothetical protein
MSLAINLCNLCQPCFCTSYFRTISNRRHEFEQPIYCVFMERMQQWSLRNDVYSLKLC